MVEWNGVCLHLKLLRGFSGYIYVSKWVGSHDVHRRCRRRRLLSACVFLSFCENWMCLRLHVFVWKKNVRGYWIWNIRRTYFCLLICSFLPSYTSYDDHHLLACFILRFLRSFVYVCCWCFFLFFFTSLIHFRRCQVHFHERIFVGRISAVFLLFSLSSCITHDCAHRSECTCFPIFELFVTTRGSISVGVWDLKHGSLWNLLTQSAHRHIDKKKRKSHSELKWRHSNT